MLEAYLIQKCTNKHIVECLIFACILIDYDSSIELLPSSNNTIVTNIY